MIRNYCITAVLAASSSLACAQEVSIYSEHDVFFNEQVGSYVEVSMLIAGWTNSSSTGDLEIVTLAMQDSTIASFKKTMLKKDMGDTTSAMVHQERIAIPAGRYELVIEVAEATGANTKIAQIQKELIVPQVANEMWLSDITLAESIAPSNDPLLAKNGYSMVPFVSTYYGPGNDQLNFYAEIHRANLQLGDGSPYLAVFEIQEFETGNTYGQFKGHKRIKASAIEAIIASFDISDVPSGNYRLKLSCLDKEGKELTTVSQFLQRNNPNADPAPQEELTVSEVPSDTLYDFLLCLAPISSELEAKMISDMKDNRDRERMENVFSNFWMSRDPDNPWGSWSRYHAEVIKVNKLYGTRVREGYETDRGYVHLKFGAPNSISDRAHDMNAYPYQIWHYYRAGKYSNKRFVFYLPDLVTNDYRLIHSEVPGEVQDPRWNQTIHSRNNPREDVMGEDPGSQSAGRARDLFDLAP